MQKSTHFVSGGPAAIYLPAFVKGEWYAGINERYPRGVLGRVCYICYCADRMPGGLISGRSGKASD